MIDIEEKINNYINLQKQTFESIEAQDTFFHQLDNKRTLLSLLENKCVKYNDESYKINFSYLFTVNNVTFLVYESIDYYFIYSTIYRLLYAVTDKKGQVIEYFNKKDCMGYTFDDELLIKKIKSLKRPRSLFRQKEPKLILMFSSLANIGHHIWNEQSGLDFLIDTNLIDKFDEIWLGKNDYLNFKKFFQENDKKVKIVDFSKPMSTKNILINHVELGVFDKTLRRLESWVLDNSSMNKKFTYPTIAIQLRQHDRIWIEEKTDLTIFINEILKIYPNASFIIDGFSKGTELSKSEKRNIKKELDVFKQIKKSLRQSIQVETTINETIIDKLSTLKNADVILSPIGSGGILANWVLNKPTICYGPTSYYDWTKKHSETYLERYNGKLFYIARENIKDIESTKNYSMDVKNLVNVTISILKGEKDVYSE